VIVAVVEPPESLSFSSTTRRGPVTPLSRLASLMPPVTTLVRARFTSLLSLPTSDVTSTAFHALARIGPDAAKRGETLGAFSYVMSRSRQLELASRTW
jgi:hypothetical protein